MTFFTKLKIFFNRLFEGRHVLDQIHLTVVTFLTDSGRLFQVFAP